MKKEYTPEELTRLHAELYDILGETVRVCREHGIEYFVIGGTAIGALYDEAILPWDDDVDIGMTRDNYEKFLRIAPTALRKDYFLSWMGSDPHTPYYFAKVKKQGTRFVEALFEGVPMHPGIYIDIFPFDRVPDNRTLRNLHREAVNFFKCCLMGKEQWMWKHFGKCRIAHPTDRGPLPCLLTRLAVTLLSKRAIYRIMAALQGCFNGRHTRYYNNVVTTTDLVEATCLHPLEPVRFGPLTLTAPQGLEAFLRFNYPTLHRFTPEEQRKVENHHPVELVFSPKTLQP